MPMRLLPYATLEATTLHTTGPVLQIMTVDSFHGDVANRRAIGRRRQHMTQLASASGFARDEVESAGMMYTNSLRMLRAHIVLVNKSSVRL